MDPKTLHTRAKHLPAMPGSASRGVLAVGAAPHQVVEDSKALVRNPSQVQRAEQQGAVVFSKSVPGNIIVTLMANPRKKRPKSPPAPRKDRRRRSNNLGKTSLGRGELNYVMGRVLKAKSEHLDRVIAEIAMQIGRSPLTVKRIVARSRTMTGRACSPARRGPRSKLSRKDLLGIVDAVIGLEKAATPPGRADIAKMIRDKARAAAGPSATARQSRVAPRTIRNYVRLLRTELGSKRRASGVTNTRFVAARSVRSACSFWALPMASVVKNWTPSGISTCVDDRLISDSDPTYLVIGKASKSALESRWRRVGAKNSRVRDHRKPRDEGCQRGNNSLQSTAGAAKGAGAENPRGQRQTDSWSARKVRDEVRPGCPPAKSPSKG